MDGRFFQKDFRGKKHFSTSIIVKGHSVLSINKPSRRRR